MGIGNPHHDDSVFAVGVQISEDELQRIKKERAIAALTEWCSTEARINSGPGTKELVLAILEPKPNGSPRTFSFSFGREEIYLDCWFVSISGLDGIPDQTCSIEMLCNLTPKHYYFFRGTYNFKTRRGWMKIPPNHA